MKKTKIVYRRGSLFLGRGDGEGVAVAFHRDVNNGILPQFRHEIEAHLVEDGKEAPDGGLHGSTLYARNVVRSSADAMTA